MKLQISHSEIECDNFHTRKDINSIKRSYSLGVSPLPNPSFPSRLGRRNFPYRCARLNSLFMFLYLCVIEFNHFPRVYSFHRERVWHTGVDCWWS